MDTHIALVADLANANDKSKHIVVEVTPRSRRRYHLPSTATLKKQILHKRVMITGWLLYDLMHEKNAANTNPNGTQIWRLTCEEIRTPIATHASLWTGSLPGLLVATVALAFFIRVASNCCARFEECFQVAAPNADELAGRFQRAETPRTDLPFEITSCAVDEGRCFLLC